MSKSEILRQLAASENAKRIDSLTKQIVTLRQTKMESVEQLAAILEPLAQAMATLTDETRETLESVDARSKAQSERIEQQIEASSKLCQMVTREVQRSADRLELSGRSMELSHYVMTLATGVLAAAIVSALWLWLAPRPIIENQLDSKAVASALAPEIARMRQFNGK